MNPTPVCAYAVLNARIMPLARGEQYEDPLADALEQNGFGELTGGGTLQARHYASRPGHRLDWPSGRAAQEPPGPLARRFATLYERLGIDVRATQFIDLAGRPQYFVGDHRPVPELMG
jgi:hypothetical protein